MKLKPEAILAFRKFELFVCLIALKKINEKKKTLKRLSNTIKYDQLKLRVKGLFCSVLFIFLLFLFCFVLFCFLFSFVRFYLFIIIFFYLPPSLVLATVVWLE